MKIKYGTPGGIRVFPVGTVLPSLFLQADPDERRCLSRGQRSLRRYVIDAKAGEFDST